MRQLFAAGIFLVMRLASGQTLGEITGEVKDQSGAVAPNIFVTVTNTGTNASRFTSTNEAGIYSFPSLAPGNYQVRVEATGFQTITRTNIELEVQQTARIDFTLVVGQAAQAVEVSAAAQMLTTENATVGTVIGQKSIEDLPLNGRNFLQLVALSPNVTYGFMAPNNVQRRQGGTRTEQNISIAGMRGVWNNYTLDGIANTDVNFNLYIQLPSVDALQEFKVQSGIYPAEFGREAGRSMSPPSPGQTTTTAPSSSSCATAISMPNRTISSAPLLPKRHSGGINMASRWAVPSGSQSCSTAGTGFSSCRTSRDSRAGGRTWVCTLRHRIPGGTEIFRLSQRLYTTRSAERQGPTDR